MTFLDAYKVYSSGNEAPPIYHEWAGISALSSMLSRRVWIPQGFFTVYPNLYILFVGNPGNGKSTAMKIARDLVRKFPKIAPIAPASITREALTQDLGDTSGPHKLTYRWHNKEVEYSHMSIFANELVTLLGTNPIGMVEFMTDIWDEDEFKVKTKNKGFDVIPRPNVTLLGCMTPETTNNLLKESIISGGFARRCVFVYATRRGNPVPRPVITPEQREAGAFCIKHGTKLSSLVGEFRWTDEAIEVFDTWYCQNHELVQENTDLLLNGYYTTKNMLVLKVGMLLALSERIEMVLEAKHIHQALALLNATEKDLSRVFEGTGRNPEAGIAAKIRTLVDTQGHAINSKIVYTKMYSHGSEDEIRAALDHLFRAEELYRFEYRPKVTSPPIEMVGTAEQIEHFQNSLTQTAKPQNVLRNSPDLNAVELRQSE